MLAYIQSNILVLLHPFIPFFTEKVWQDFNFEEYYKTPLLLKNWDLKSQSTFSKSHHKISWLIDLVSAIRSTKVNLNISPGEFIEISTSELSTKSSNIVNDNSWKFITVVRNSGTYKYYINNSLDVTKTGQDSKTFNSNDLVIGWDYRNNNSGFEGNLGAVFFYNTDLTIDQVVNNYNTTKSRYGH